MSGQGDAGAGSKRQRTDPSDTPMVEGEEANLPPAPPMVSLKALCPLQTFVTAEDFLGTGTIPDYGKLVLLADATLADKKALRRFPNHIPHRDMNATFVEGSYIKWTIGGAPLSEAAMDKMRAMFWARSKDLAYVFASEDYVFGLPPYCIRDGTLYLGHFQRINVTANHRFQALYKAALGLLKGTKLGPNAVDLARHIKALDNLPQEVKGDKVAVLAAAITERDVAKFLIVSGDRSGPAIYNAATSALGYMCNSMSFAESIKQAEKLEGNSARTNFLSQVGSVRLPLQASGRRALLRANGEELKAVELASLADDAPVIINDGRAAPGQIASFKPEFSVWSADAAFERGPGRVKDAVVRPLAVKTVPAGILKQLAKLMVLTVATAAAAPPAAVADVAVDPTAAAFATIEDF